jgi:guanidinopropionase
VKKDPRFQPVDAAVTPRFSGIATFMRTQRHEIGPDVDVALAGVPFDIGVNYRTGARQGPAAVREASRLIRRVHQSSGIAPYDICNVADVGDAPVNPIDLTRSIAMIEQFYRKIHAVGAVPISIGGDHTVPLPILRAIARAEPVGIVQIDSHADTLDELAGIKNQSCDNIPPRRGRGSHRSQAGYPDRPARLALLARRHQMGRGQGLHLHHLRSLRGDGP